MGLRRVICGWDIWGKIVEVDGIGRKFWKGGACGCFLKYGTCIIGGGIGMILGGFRYSVKLFLVILWED